MVSSFRSALSRAGLTVGYSRLYHAARPASVKPFNRGGADRHPPQRAIPFIPDGWHRSPHRQHAPNVEPGETLVTLTGEDISVMMDLEEKRTLSPMSACADIRHRRRDPGCNMHNTRTAAGRLHRRLLSERAAFADRSGCRRSKAPTCEMLREAGRTRNGYVFYIEAGPLVAPLVWVNTAYFGTAQTAGPAAIGARRSALAATANVSKARPSNTTRWRAATVSATRCRTALTGAEATRWKPSPAPAHAAIGELDPALDPPAHHTHQSLFEIGSGGLDIIQRLCAAHRLATDPSADGTRWSPQRAELDVHPLWPGALRARGLVGRTRRRLHP